MNYIKKHLSDNEDIIYESGIHWFIFVRPLSLLLLGTLIYTTASTIVYYASLVILIAGGLDLLKRILEKIGSIYAVTTKKVILKSGIIRRDALELMIHKCEGIRINQGLWGRIFNFGSIIVTTGGASNTYRYAPAPMKFKNAINNQL